MFHKFSVEYPSVLYIAVLFHEDDPGYMPYYLL